VNNKVITGNQEVGPNISKDQTTDTNSDNPAEDEMRAKFLSNHTHYSTTDPDARIAVKQGKPRHLIT
jgi:cupin superfamily acireductone dioxygenase involved in methionine salvage